MQTKEERNAQGLIRLKKWVASRPPEEIAEIKRKSARIGSKRFKERYEKMTEQEKIDFQKRKYAMAKKRLASKSQDEKDRFLERQRERAKERRDKMTEEERIKIRQRENDSRKKRAPTDEQIKNRKEYSKRWYLKNKNSVIKKSYVNRAKNLKENISYRIKIRCNARLRRAIHAQGAIKSNKTIELLGCSPIYLKSHLEKQFNDKMDWDNYGTYWHIDHIIPCNAFNLIDIEQQKKCFHYTNLRPLEAIENISKSDKIKENGSTLSDASIETITFA